MPYIAECKAPDLSDLGASLVDRSTLSVLFSGKSFPAAEPLMRLATGYFVVTDKAVREYCAGRDALIAYSNSANETQLFFEGLGRFENCINSAKRALRLLDRLGSQQGGLAINRTLRRQIESLSLPITGIRDCIEHIDGDIVTGSVSGQDMPHLLAINTTGDCLEIGEYQLPLDDLARVVRKLHEVGCGVIQALPAR